MLRRAGASVLESVRRVWGLIHGYDDIRGSRLDNSIPEGPTEEERAAAQATAIHPVEPDHD